MAAIALGISIYIVLTGDVELPSPQDILWPERKTDETADWKIYQNEEYGFEVKYPSHYTLRERDERNVHLIDFYPAGEQNLFDFSLAISHNEKKLPLREYLADSYKFSDLRFDGIKTKQGITALKPAKQSDEYWEKFSPLGSGLEYNYWFVGSGEWVISLYHSQAVAISADLATQILPTFKFIK